MEAGNDKESGRFLRTWGVALLIVVALAAWMLSGVLGGKEPDAPATAPDAETADAFHVLVSRHDAVPIQRKVRFSGDTQPDQIINLAAQVEGQVLAVGAAEGARLAKGALIARIDMRDLKARVARARAVLHQRELEHKAAGPLRDEGIITEAEFAAAIANRDSARAELENIQLQLRNVKITAPADGILEQRLVEVGDFVKIGNPVAELLVNDPLTVSGGVSENDIGLIRVGMPASATLSDGTELDGVVRFVSARARESTRTYTVEVAVSNPDASIPAGRSAEVSIPVQEIRAHKVPSSLLALDDDGRLGLKSVDDNGTVTFHVATIERADGDAIWVSGLPESLDLITRGQGFVQAGETVAITRDDDA